MISIIVPIYNASAVLGRCVESVLYQSFCDFELLLINDGSIDESLDICRQYMRKDKRVKVITQDNRGVSFARNKGIEASNGDWIFFLDSDDELTPNCLDELVRKIEEEKQIICCSSKKNTGEIFVKFGNDGFCANSKKSAGPALLFGAPWGKLFNASIIKKYNIRFNNDIAKNEDTIFFWEYMKYVNRISTTAEIGYVYYVSNNPKSLHNKLVEPMLILHTQEILQEKFRELEEKWYVDDESLLELRHWMSSFYLDSLITSYKLLYSFSERKKIWELINKEELLSNYIPKTSIEKKILASISDKVFFKTNVILFCGFYLPNLIKKHF